MTGWPAPAGHPSRTWTIDGTRLHALHVRSARPDAPVLVLLHGWPSSVVEFQQVVRPLAETVHVVVPSLPGDGFSGPTPDGGWTSQRMARAVAELPARLGYDRYAVHGGYWGRGWRATSPSSTPTTSPAST